jgi:hypothetical protein
MLPVFGSPGKRQTRTNSKYSPEGGGIAIKERKIHVEYSADYATDQGRSA